MYVLIRTDNEVEMRNIYNHQSCTILYSVKSQGDPEMQKFKLAVSLVFHYQLD